MEALTAQEIRSKPAGRTDHNRPPGRRYVRTGSARIFPVSKDDTAVGREAGAKHLDKALKQLGFIGNVEFAELAGVADGMVSKYRNGKALPTTSSLGKIVDAIVEVADARGLYFDPVEFYVRFGLITREALQQEPIDEIFVELIRLDHEAESYEFEHQLFREQLRALMELTQRRLDTVRAAEKPRRRSAG
jgi:transcriptional regulator with XRE-family HTH domain